MTNRSYNTTSPAGDENRRLFLTSGAAYGLVFGLSFALILWGRDGLLLARSGATLSWSKLLLGLPLAIALCTLTGWLSALSSSASIYIVLWAVAGGLLGVMSGRLPFGGGDLAAWLTDRRFWGLVVFPYERAAEVRTTLTMLTGVMLGLVVGFVESLAVQWAWDRGTDRGRMSLQSWLVLLVCVPLTIPLVWLVEDQVNQRLRVPQQRIGDSVSLILAGGDKETFMAKGLNYPSFKAFHEQISGDYALYLVSYKEVSGFTTAQVDAVFNDGFTLRCETTETGTFLTPNHRVLNCVDMSKKFSGWMDDLIHAGLTGEQRWLENRDNRIAVDDQVVAWLEDHGEQFSESYQVAHAGQQGGWILLSAQFEHGFEMTCRFHGAYPVQVDLCTENSSASP